ncbi:inositol-pentakisphosphate 2-kinase [Leptopilina boulardi]|uniref:inositol-pentakisphosphate 2-kinase n=1 Tax=Leptopilina boulardi TaxID=63433 RepID=UPI0021F50F75|nr:inositol-pentakisphosphate 2-kinase [Leptopilina boulardi]XP_051164351.1 inositol-pentakisphosphate 2-kinase [Leptopilina boulardi]XP_051164352.1 inositol-pentakisphosphate 2-kinase [Leptopilina boulardi]XP_051164353.1 inositol-pentakisphosphate 2-kinase [Leptopilina boulardi]XP_051164354.1 inositol-pentakisphosphate 2-kinase [Leptopilina boulardi]
MILEKEGTSTKTSASLAIKSIQISRTSENVSKMISDVQKHKIHSLPFECAYRGEGNANLVIAVPYEHKVIRFRKCDTGNYSSDGGLNRVNRERDFIKMVLSPFLQPYLNVPEILRFDRTELDEFSKMIYSLRPEQRRFKQAVEEYATKFPDHAFLPEFLNCREKVSARNNKSIFCVEIKPKQGFLSKNDQQFQKCPYCLTQYHKLEKKSISRRSGYCPFDLFSGERNRMHRALKGLLQDPQNNFKIFKDGIVVYDQNSEANDLNNIFKEWFPNIIESSENREKKNYLDSFCFLIQEALLRKFPNENQDLNRNSMAFDINQDIEVLSRLSSEIVAKAKKMLYFTNEECDFTSTDLPHGSVLKQILEMQQLHCCGDDIISWIYSKYSTILDDELIYSSLINVYQSRGIIQRSSFFNNYMNSAINDDYYTKNDGKKKEMQNSIKDSILLLNRQKSHDRNKRRTLENFSVQNNRLLDKLPTDKEIVFVENYLLFCTARDCSILIAFQEMNPNEYNNINDDYIIQISEELKFLTSVRISDLDPKSVHSIEKHCHRDLQTLKSVIHIIEEELVQGRQIQSTNSIKTH